MKFKLNRKAVTIAIVLATPLIMGASCGSDRAIWNNPSQPLDDFKPVIDAHKQAAKDIGKGADAVSNWGSEFAKGWNQADEPKPEKNCKPWKIMCQGSD